MKSLDLQQVSHLEALCYVHLGSDSDALRTVVNPHSILKVRLIPHKEQCASDKPVRKFCIGKMTDYFGGHRGFINTLIHLVVCLMTCLKPFPKRTLHKVRS